LESQYAELSAKYGASHPDLVSIRRQLEELGSGDVVETERSILADQFKILQSEFDQASKKFGPEHPEVKRLQRAIESTKDLLALQEPDEGSGSFPDNPTYIQTQAQLSGVNAELDAARLQMEALQERARVLEERVFRSPEVERNYVALKREYDAAVAKYEGIRAKESEAELAQNLEAERMGEKLSVIEPPLVPTRPIKPNRPLVLAVGFLLATAGGIGGTIAIDALGGRVYGGRQLASVLGEFPLAVVPFIRTRSDRRKALILWVITFVCIAAIFASVAIYIHFRLMPFDLLWLVIARRAGL
jgi:uncharacterized protein involved in exopolysaccharide biosynthesis